MHAVQLQAEKVLRTWMREGVFAADILADYEVSAILIPPSNLSDTAGCDLTCTEACAENCIQPKSYAGNPERC